MPRRVREVDHARLLELARKDKRVLIESCFSVVDGRTQKVVPFLFRFAQDLYWGQRTLCDYILKYRKPGFSTLIDAEFLAACILEENVHALVVAHRDEDTQLLFQRVVWMKDHLPFRVPVKAEGAGYLVFPQTNSDFRAITARGKEPGRGRDVTHLHLSERGFYPEEDFLAAVEEACVPGARRVIETTANGQGSPAHKFWLRTQRGETAYKPHFMAWWRDPAYTAPMPSGGLGDLDETEQRLVEAYKVSPPHLAWRRAKLREMSNPDLFVQEYPSSAEEAWLVSGRMVFDWLAVHRLAQAAATPKYAGRLLNRGKRVEFDPAPGGELTVWVLPREDRRYVVSADVSEGLVGGAWSVADVYDEATWEQVAQWRGHVSPPAFADVLGDLGAFYNWGLLVPEVNNHGLATIARLLDQGYSNLYVRNAGESAREARREDYGWQTTQRTKIQMINNLGQAVRLMDLKINSPVTLEELKSYVYLRTEESSAAGHVQMGPQAGAFGDCVMTAAIGVSVLLERRETPVASRRRFREALGLPPRHASREVKAGYGVRKI